MHYSSLFHKIYGSATVPILVENSFYYFKYDVAIIPIICLYLYVTSHAIKNFMN